MQPDGILGPRPSGQKGTNIGALVITYNIFGVPKYNYSSRGLNN